MTRHLVLAMAGLLLPLLPVLPAAAAEPPAPVTVQAIETLPGSARITLPATVSARRATALSVESDGLVEAVLVDEGDAVLEGTPLVRLRATRKSLELDAARARLRHAQAAGTLANLTERRQLQLAKQKMTAQGALDEARAQSAQARAEVATAQADIARLEDELTRMELRAPYAAVVSHKHVDPGAWLRPGDRVLDITETAVLRADFALPQQHLAHVAPGTPLELTLDAYPGKTLALKVTRLVPVVREAGRTLLTRAEFPNLDGRYAPGMSGSVSLAVGGSGPVAGVPVDAVVRQPDGGALVWRVQRGADGPVAVPVPVRLGRRLDGRFEVLDTPGPVGLPPGAQVVVRGNERLRPGQPVAPTDATAP